MADITALNAAVDAAINNKTTDNSITPADVGDAIKAANNELRPYKVYTAVLSQSGTNAPTVGALLENTIGAIVWSREFQGHYRATLAGAFPENKVAVICTNGGLNRLVTGNRFDNDQVGISTNETNTGTQVDGALASATIEIRVYP